LRPLFFCDVMCSRLVVGYLCFGTTFQFLLQDQSLQEVSVLTLYSRIKCLCIHSVPLSRGLVPTVYSHIKPVCAFYFCIWYVCAYYLFPHMVCLYLLFIPIRCVCAYCLIPHKMCL